MNEQIKPSVTQNHHGNDNVNMAAGSINGNVFMHNRKHNKKPRGGDRRGRRERNQSKLLSRNIPKFDSFEQPESLSDGDQAMHNMEPGEYDSYDSNQEEGINNKMERPKLIRLRQSRSSVVRMNKDKHKKNRNTNEYGHHGGNRFKDINESNRNYQNRLHHDKVDNGHRHSRNESNRNYRHRGGHHSSDRRRRNAIHDVESCRHGKKRGRYGHESDETSQTTNSRKKRKR